MQSLVNLCSIRERNGNTIKPKITIGPIWCIVIGSNVIRTDIYLAHLGLYMANACFCPIFLSCSLQWTSCRRGCSSSIDIISALCCAVCVCVCVWAWIQSVGNWQWEANTHQRPNLIAFLHAKCRTTMHAITYIHNDTHSDWHQNCACVWARAWVWGRRMCRDTVGKQNPADWISVVKVSSEACWNRREIL